MKITLPIASACAILSVFLPAYATNTSFSATSGDWNVAGNWTAGIPTNADTATVSNGRSATVSGATSAVGRYIYVGHGTSGDGTLTVDGGLVDVTGSTGTGELRLGWSNEPATAGNGTLSVINGGYITGYLIAIARGPSTGYTVNSNYQGWLSIDSASSVSVSTIELGRRGRTGNMELLGTSLSSGATVTVTSFNLGVQSGSAKLTIGKNAVVNVLSGLNLAGTGTGVNSGTAHITVSNGSLIARGVGSVYGHATFYLNNASVTISALKVFAGGTLSADVRVAGTSVSGTSVSTNTFTLSGGGVLDGNLTVDGSSTATFAVLLSGAVGSVAAATIDGTLTGVSGGTITIDFTTVTGLAIGSEVTVLLADSASGISLGSILTTGLDASLQAIYSTETVGSQQALIATIAAIPEPAVAAAVMALLGMVAVMRRRK